MSRIDIDFNFRPHPLTGDIPLKKGSQAVAQSLRNIVLTSFYERGFNVAFGTNVRSSLFELYSPLDLLTMKDFIKEAIKNFEPDVEVLDVIVNNANENDYSIDVVITYTEFNNPQVKNVELKMSRLR